MTGYVNRPARCGTMSGYSRHLRLGETACGPCTQANRDKSRAYYLRASSGYRLSYEEALASLGLPPDRAGSKFMTRVLVTGSRTWHDRSAVVDALDEVLAEHGTLTVVHGDAAGADRMARDWARCHSLDGQDLVTENAMPADWQRNGKRAGFIRNGEMVNAGADICLAFIRDGSPGASHCADLAEKCGIPVRRFTA